MYTSLTKGSRMKMLKVSIETHKLIKIQAALRGMSIKEYIRYLAEKDQACFHKKDY